MANPNDPDLKQQHQDLGAQIEQLEQQVQQGSAPADAQQQLDTLRQRQRQLHDQMGQARQANLDQQKDQRSQEKDRRKQDRDER